MAEKMWGYKTEYAIVRLLGNGKGGYSYLMERDGHLYVLKQIHQEPYNDYQQRNRELDKPVPCGGL